MGYAALILKMRSFRFVMDHLPLKDTVPLLRTSVAHLWLIGPDGLAARSPLCRESSLVTEAERQRASRFRHEGARRRFIAGRFLLRMMMSTYLQVPHESVSFQPGVRGKLQPGNPAHQNVHFNLSHTDDLLVAAFALGQEIGVDIERIRDSGLETRIARQHFARTEILQLEQLPEQARLERFFELWTLKESYAKALGLGLHLAFNSFAFDFGTRHDNYVKLIRDCEPCEQASIFWLAKFRPDDRIALTVLDPAMPIKVDPYRLFSDGSIAELDHTPIRW